MDLNAIAGPVVAAVNPTIPVTVRISTGSGEIQPDGSRAPSYASPGALVGSIAGNVLTVTAVSLGAVQTGQILSGSGVAAGTSVVEQLTGDAGGAGTYEVSRSQTVASAAMTTDLVLRGQIQPITSGDLRQLEGVNLGGVRWKIYLEGEVDGMVRPERKGGDLVVVAAGKHQGTWLVVQVLEQFQDWACAAIVLQNGG